MKLPKDFIEKMNAFGQAKRPFLFIIDFEQKRPVLFPLDELPDDVQYSFGKQKESIPSEDISIAAFPESFQDYKRKFDEVHHAIHQGESYLLNLTCQTPILLSADLETVYRTTSAKYKLKYKDEFVCFSPEPFVRIADDKIISFPMKGTIDADILNAAQLLSTDEKELAEHYTIVDLIRNDLSRVATNVTVDRFKYLEKISTGTGAILQQSTEISGLLESDWENNLGDIFDQLLPAGSISGAPKKKTIEVIRQAEGMDRGYYTGIFGVYDGTSVDSGVMIRFIEKDNDQYFFRSGGGITHQSIAEEEYQEMIQKIYVPILRKHQNSESEGASLALSSR